MWRTRGPPDGAVLGGGAGAPPAADGGRNGYRRDEQPPAATARGPTRAGSRTRSCGLDERRVLPRTLSSPGAIGEAGDGGRHPVRCVTRKGPRPADRAPFVDVCPRGGTLPTAHRWDRAG